jgi:hypothetical protein
MFFQSVRGLIRPRHFPDETVTKATLGSLFSRRLRHPSAGMGLRLDAASGVGPSHAHGVDQALSLSLTRLAASALFLLLTAQSIAATTHCTSAEDVVFSCPLQRMAKVVSVCASPRLLASQGRGYLVYRFGKPGAVELEFPKDKVGSPAKFVHSHYFRAQTDRTQLRFTSGDFTYELFDEFEQGAKPPSTVGVRVIQERTGQVTQLACGKGVTAHWNLIDGAVPANDD